MINVVGVFLVPQEQIDRLWDPLRREGAKLCKELGYTGGAYVLAFERPWDGAQHPDRLLRPLGERTEVLDGVDAGGPVQCG
jgi:hypothetical protein